MFNELTGLKAVDEMLTKAFWQTANVTIETSRKLYLLSGIKNSPFFVYDEICNVCIKNT